MSDRLQSKSVPCSIRVGGLLSGLWICSCVGAAPTQEQTALAPTTESSRPVTNIPTTLTLDLNGEKLSLPASARLQLGIDERIELTAATQAPGNVFSMRLTIPTGTTKLQGTRFELAQGFAPTNELGIVRGELPNVTPLRSLAGSVDVLTLREEELELRFDAMLSSDPRAGSDALHASGTLTGVANLVCLQKSTPSDGVRVESKDGQAQVVSAIRLDDARCQPLRDMLERD